MAADVALLGSSSDHGGTIISASPDVYACGVKVARCGDRHACPIPGHGVTEIVVCDPTVFANGRGVARVGDTAGCGASIRAGCSGVHGTEGRLLSDLG